MAMKLWRKGKAQTMQTAPQLSFTIIRAHGLYIYVKALANLGGVE